MFIERYQLTLNISTHVPWRQLADEQGSLASENISLFIIIHSFLFRQIIAHKIRDGRDIWHLWFANAYSIGNDCYHNVVGQSSTHPGTEDRCTRAGTSKRRKCLTGLQCTFLRWDTDSSHRYPQDLKHSTIVSCEKCFQNQLLCPLRLSTLQTVNLTEFAVHSRTALFA